MKKFRFDNNYENIYKYDKNLKAYIFWGTYYMYDITHNMTYREAVKIIKKIEQ